MYTDLNSFITGEQDPDIGYFVIKQNHENSGKEISIGVPSEKHSKIALMIKIDVFKGVMQYIEEYGIYFLAYLDTTRPISDSIIRIDPKKVKTAFKKFNDESHDEFAIDKGYSNYTELLTDIFDLPSKDGLNDKDIEESLINIKKANDKMAWFYIFYSDLYNAIKHGYRVFKMQYDLIEIHDEKGVIKSIELNEEYFDAVCKEELGGNLYVLIYPSKALLVNSIRVLEDTREVFNYLRKTNKYEKSKFFNHNVLRNFLVYTRMYNDTYSIYLPYSEDLEKKHASSPKIKHAGILVKDKKIEFHLSDKESIEYPFTVKWGPHKDHHPKPGIKSDLKISSCLNMDVG
jgi:hypothetical protein